LSTCGWTYDGDWYTEDQLGDLLAYLITNNYTCNVGNVRRQIMGMPVGISDAPQIGNLAFYPVEKKHAYKLGSGKD